MRRRSGALLALVAAGALVAGCGDDSSSDSESAAAPETTAAAAAAAPAKLETTFKTSAGDLVATGANEPAVLKAALAEKDWGWPVDVADCTNDTKGCEKGVKTPGIYQPVAKASKAYKFCLLVPYIDNYWLAINYGVVEEARRNGAEITMQSANGYQNLPAQINQLNNCAASGADAILLAAVSGDGLNAQIKQVVAKGIPVIDLGNGVTSPEVKAHAAVTYYTLGKMVGEYLVSKDEPIKLGWFPGPPGASWSETSTVGVKEAIEGSKVELVATKYAGVDKSSQLTVVENTLQAQPDMTYIGGASIATEAAAPLLKNKGLADKIGMVADYTTPPTLDLLRKGQIECASTDMPVILGRIAVDQAIRLLDKTPMIGGKEFERVEPHPFMVCGPAAGELNNIDEVPLDAMVAPDGFKPSTK